MKRSRPVTAVGVLAFFLALWWFARGVLDFLGSIPSDVEAEPAAGQGVKQKKEIERPAPRQRG